MKVAIIHDWLVTMRGAEKCLESFCRLFPDADIYTLFHLPDRISPVINRHRIHVSPLQHVPGLKSLYRYLLPLMPRAIEGFRLDGYDLVLSNSHCVAKGVRVPDGCLHICYCHSPMRYLWDQYDLYFSPKRSGFLTRAAMKRLAPSLKRWDVSRSEEVDFFIANSRNVEGRIRRHYRRDSEVIPPPVDVEFFTPSGAPGEGYYLVISALVPNKQVELAVEACNELGYPLIVVGEGPMAKELKRRANPSIRFTGWLPDEEIRSLYARCRAFLFTGEDDFGITPLEAHAMGRPVIALARGGALESVVPDRESWKSETGIPASATDHPTGVFFHEPTARALVDAIRHFETIEHRFDPGAIRRHAEPFGTRLFQDRIRQCIEQQTQRC